MVLFSLTAGPNGTQFRSLRPLGLNRIRFCPGRPVLNGTRFCSRTAESQRNPVLFTPDSCITTELGSVHPGGCFSTELSSAHGRPILNGTQFRSRAAASQRNPVLFTPDSCITTELGSVHPGGRFSTEPGSVHPGGWFSTELSSVLPASSSQRNSIPFPDGSSQRNPVLFPRWRLPTELGSVPGVAVPNGTRFRSRMTAPSGTRLRSRPAASNGTRFRAAASQRK